MGFCDHHVCPQSNITPKFYLSRWNGAVITKHLDHFERWSTGKMLANRNSLFTFIFLRIVADLIQLKPFKGQTQTGECGCKISTEIEERQQTSLRCKVGRKYKKCLIVILLLPFILRKTLHDISWSQNESCILWGKFSSESYSRIWIDWTA